MLPTTGDVTLRSPFAVGACSSAVFLVTSGLVHGGVWGIVEGEGEVSTSSLHCLTTVLMLTSGDLTAGSPVKPSGGEIMLCKGVVIGTVGGAGGCVGG